MFSFQWELVNALSYLVIILFCLVKMFGACFCVIDLTLVKFANSRRKYVNKICSNRNHVWLSLRVTDSYGVRKQIGHCSLVGRTLCDLERTREAWQDEEYDGANNLVSLGAYISLFCW